ERGFEPIAVLLPSKKVERFPFGEAQVAPDFLLRQARCAGETQRCDPRRRPAGGRLRLSTTAHRDVVPKIHDNALVVLRYEADFGVRPRAIADDPGLLAAVLETLG